MVGQKVQKPDTTSDQRDSFNSIEENAMIEKSKSSNQREAASAKIPKNYSGKLVRRKRNEFTIDTAGGVTYLAVPSMGETIMTAIDGPLMTTIDLLKWSVVRGQTGIYFASALPDVDRGRDPIGLHEFVYLISKEPPIPGFIPDHVNTDPYEGKRTLYIKIERVRSSGLVVDHKDRDTLNNRASNLRLLPQQLNSMNSAKVLEGSSRYPGVSLDSAYGKFRAITTVDGVQVPLGYSERQEDAAILVLAKLMEIYPTLDWGTYAEEFYPGIPVPGK